MEFNACNSDNVFYSDWYGLNEYTWLDNRLCGDMYTVHCVCYDALMIRMSGENVYRRKNCGLV